MCGIVGTIGLPLPDPAVLVHRGPDGTAAVCVEADIAFGHTRLAIRGGDGGAQPMWSRSGQSVIVYNGELYNADELRSRLSGPWRTTCDTEVLLAACEAWGVEEACRRARGMWAFALWDTHTQSMWLARDRFGVKPLYWWADGPRLMFASEARVFPRAVDWQSMTAFVRYGYVPGPYSIWQGVRKLQPGTLLLWQYGSTRTITYWEPEQQTGRAHDIRSAVTDACRSALVADVPVGALLSGGVDSSLVCAIARPTRTYCAGFEHAHFDERPYAQAVANALGLAHRSFVMTDADAARVVPRLVDVYDEPFADSSAAVTVWLAEQVRADGIKVVLTGDGGDELFGGYGRYRRAHTPASYARHMGHWHDAASITGVKARADRLVAPRLRAVSDALARMMLADVQLYLPDDLLVKVDRACMAVGLEARPALLDHRVLGAAWADRRIGKPQLRDILRRWLPDALIDRPKMGFGVPITQWLDGPLREYEQDVLAGARLAWPEPATREQRWIRLMAEAWLVRQS